MSKCRECETEDNLVYSGVDALVLGIAGAETGIICYPCANKNRLAIKGANLKLGDGVHIMIINKGASQTNLHGEITALQKFQEKIWVQVAGIDSWIILGDSVEIRVV
jgi:hypothetical protein